MRCFSSSATVARTWLGMFDAIEFNDELSCTDVLYDLAFLLMDLWRRTLPRHANAVWNAYLAGTMGLDGLPLLPLFLSCRAAVRAKTSVTAAGLQDDPERTRELHATAREYLAMADTLLRPPPAPSPTSSPPADPTATLTIGRRALRSRPASTGRA